MSLGEEKILILKMLEEGKITSEEAARLLEALESETKQASEKGENAYRQQQKQQNFQDEISKVRDRLYEWKKEFNTKYSQKDFDHAMEEFSKKAENLGKTLASTTFSFVDKMVDFVGSFVDTNAFNFFGNCPLIEKNFEAVAVDGMNIEIEGVNSYIVVKKHADSKIIIKSRIKTPSSNADSVIMFNDTGNLVSLKLNKIGNISIGHEIFLPAVKFKKIKLETSNGRIYVEDSLSEVFEAVTRNSHIELMGINSDIINASTRNAKIQINYIVGRDIEINTTNSVIDIKHIKAQNIKAVTTNGRILAENVQNYQDAAEMFMSLKTTNGGIKINMNDLDDRGYKVKAQTTNGSVNLLIPDMVYHNVNRQGNSGSYVEAESSSYADYHQKVNINTETANGYIEIVK